MAFIDTPTLVFYPRDVGRNTSPTSVRIFTLDADGEKGAFIFQCSEDCTIDKVLVNFGTVVQCTNGLRVSLQDVSSGSPDGTQDAYRVIPTGEISTESQPLTGKLTSDGTDTGTQKTVSSGDLLAVVVEFESFDTGDDVDLRLAMDGPWATVGRDWGDYYNTYTAGAWVGPISWSRLNVGVMKTDGEWMRLYDAFCSQKNNGLSRTTASTPDEVGLKFTLPVPMRSVGAGYMGTFSTGSAPSVVLYDEDSNVLRSKTLVDAAAQQVVGGYGDKYVYWDPIELSKDTTYRLVWKPTNTTAAVIMTHEIADSSYIGQTPWGADAVPTVRTDGGSWTDYAGGETNAWFPALNLIIDAIDPVKGVSLPTQFLTPSIFSHMRIVNR